MDTFIPFLFMLRTSIHCCFFLIPNTGWPQNMFGYHAKNKIVGKKCRTWKFVEKRFLSSHLEMTIKFVNTNQITHSIHPKCKQCTGTSELIKINFAINFNYTRITHIPNTPCIFIILSIHFFHFPSLVVAYSSGLIGIIYFWYYFGYSHMALAVGTF